jgi:hypothetical protein
VWHKHGRGSRREAWVGATSQQLSHNSIQEKGRIGTGCPQQRTSDGAILRPEEGLQLAQLVWIHLADGLILQPSSSNGAGSGTVDEAFGEGLRVSGGSLQ